MSEDQAKNTIERINAARLRDGKPSLGNRKHAIHDSKPQVCSGKTREGWPCCRLMGHTGECESILDGPPPLRDFRPCLPDAGPVCPECSDSKAGCPACTPLQHSRPTLPTPVAHPTAKPPIAAPARPPRKEIPRLPAGSRFSNLDWDGHQWSGMLIVPWGPGQQTFQTHCNGVFGLLGKLDQMWRLWEKENVK